MPRPNSTDIKINQSSEIIIYNRSESIIGTYTNTNTSRGAIAPMFVTTTVGIPDLLSIDVVPGQGNAGEQIS